LASVNHSATAFLNAVRFASEIDPLGGLRTDNLKGAMTGYVVGMIAAFGVTFWRIAANS
jgi:hypothetical protein